MRNTINSNIKTSTASYYSNAFSQSKGNFRKTWQTINELTSPRTNNTTVKEFKSNGSIISNSSELSNAFNDHFSTIFNDIAQQDWTCNGFDDPNVLWADWKTKFSDVVNFHAPIRTRRARVKKAPSLDEFRIKERHARS